MTTTRKILIGAVGVICFFVITNPSIRSFKEHQGKSSLAGLVRKYDFFIFSIYYDRANYLGIAGNFFQIKESDIIVKTDYSKTHLVKVDSPATLDRNNNMSNGIDLFSKDSTTHYVPNAKIDSELDAYIKKHPIKKK